MGEGNNLIGVDIGSSAIKVCQVKETRKGRVLQRLGYVPLPPQAIVDGQISDRHAVIDALKRAFHDAKIRGKAVAMSVSGQSVIIRKISVPMMTPAELAEQITWEAEQHIPFEIKDVQVDYQVLRKRPDASQMDLLLVAAKRDQISEYAQLAKDARLNPLVVDIDAFTMQNAFEAAFGVDETRCIALINVGASTVSLNVVSAGTSAFTREIATGGNAINEELRRQLGMAPELAESYKCGTASDPIPREALQVIDSVLDTIGGEIQRSLDFFMATSGEADISQIYLTGGTANLPALAAAVQRRARVPVQVWSPLQGITIDKGISRALVEQRAAQMVVAIGLTLRRQREIRS